MILFSGKVPNGSKNVQIVHKTFGGLL